MLGVYGLGGALGVLAVAALLATLTRSALALVYPLCAVAALLLGAVDLHVLLSDGSLSTSLPLGLPTVGLQLRVDPMSAFFGVVVNGGLLTASLYGLGLDRQTELTRRVEPLFPIFAAAISCAIFCCKLMAHR